jgi:hypothetical protein
MPGENALTPRQLEQAASLAADSKRRCAPLPPVVGANQPVPPALRTSVLAEIVPNDLVCHNVPLAASDGQRGITRRVLLTVSGPDRRLLVSADAQRRPRSLSAAVSWDGAATEATESAGVDFTADGSATRATRTVSDAAAGGRGGTYPLSAAEIARARALAVDVLRRCS